MRELKSDYVVLGDIQRFPGYTLLLCKECKKELHELEPGFRAQFLADMALLFMEANFEKYVTAEKLPCFIASSRCIGIKGMPDVCFVQGGY